MRIAIIFCCTLVANLLNAEQRSYSFRWEGSAGYWLEGGMHFDTSDAFAGVIREWDVTCFEIKGYRGEQPLGRWALDDLTSDTAWRLHFDVDSGDFLVVGGGHEMPQAWNMRGDGSGCGPGGFGFNLGNIAQDVCVDDQVVVESQAASEKPFPATRDDAYDFPPDACYGPDLLSALQP